jgi:hypothetical protein
MAPVPKGDAQPLQETVAGDYDGHPAGFLEDMKGQILENNILRLARFYGKRVVENVIDTADGGIPPYRLDNPSVHPEPPTACAGVHLELQARGPRANGCQEITERAETEPCSLSGALNGYGHNKPF